MSWKGKRLRAHSARVVPLVRRLGHGLDHVIRHHIEGGTEWAGDRSNVDVLAKNLPAHVDMSSGGLVCRVKCSRSKQRVLLILTFPEQAAPSQKKLSGATAPVAARVGAPVAFRKTVKY